MPSWIVPPDNVTPGGTGHDAAHDEIADDLTDIATAFPGVQNGVAYSIRSVSSNYTALASDDIILATAALTITLPTSVSAGKRYILKNTSTGTLTIAPASGTIDGGASIASNTRYDFIEVVFDGTNYQIISASRVQGWLVAETGVYSNGVLASQLNTLDDGSGNTTIAGYLQVNGTGGINVVEGTSGHAGQVDISGPGDGSQYSNFILSDTADGHLWAFSFREPSHEFLIFNYNGTAYTDALTITETGALGTVGGSTLDDGSGNLTVTGQAFLHGIDSNGKLQTPNIATKTSNYTITTSDYAIIANNTSNAITLTLPDATTCKGQQFAIFCLTNNFNVPVDTVGGQTVAGLSSGSLDFGASGQSATLISDGTNWQIISAAGIAASFASINEAFFLAGLDILNGPFTTQQIVTKTASYTLTTSDYCVLANPSSSAITLTMPDATTCLGQHFLITTLSGTNAVTLDTVSSQTIAGEASGAWSFTVGGVSLELMSDGANWQVISSQGLAYYSSTLQTAYFINGLVSYGVAAHTAGTDTSSTATASTPSLTSGTAARINTTQDVMLYCNIKVASTFSLKIGPTSTPATTVVASATAGVGLISVRIPKGWYVQSTFTSADVAWTAVTC